MEREKIRLAQTKHKRDHCRIERKTKKNNNRMAVNMYASIQINDKT